MRSVLALSLLFITSCAPQCQRAGQCPSLEERGLDISRVAERDSRPPIPAFALGVEYNQLGLAAAHASTGVTWSKTRLEAFEWGKMEPRAPVAGRHSYDWSCTDLQVAEWQQAGMVNIQSYMSPKNSWAQDGSNVEPKPAHVENYKAWVRAMIERYDGDGKEDMPGLVRPVKHWVMGGEWTGFWPKDDAEGYLSWLAMTAAEAKAAYSDVQVGLIPFFLIDVFEGNEPSDSDVESRVERQVGHRNSGAGMKEMLNHPDLFDYVDVHSLGDYTELPPLARWFRSQMQARGYQKPIWVDDAFPMSLLTNCCWDNYYPVNAGNRDAVFDVLMAVAKGEDPDGSRQAWVRAEAARGTVKKAVTALGEGFVGIQLGNTEDWMPDQGAALRSAMVNLIGASAMMGILDVSHPDGLGYEKARRPGPPRAAHRNLKLLHDMLGDGAFDNATRMGGVTGARGYRLERAGQPLWVLWSEDGILQLPGEAEAALRPRIEVPDGFSAVRVTRSVEAAGEEPAVTQLNVEMGSVELSVGPAPVFVEAIP